MMLKDYKRGATFKTDRATIYIGRSSERGGKEHQVETAVIIKPRFRDGSSAAKAGPILVPPAPPGANVDRNMQIASEHWGYRTGSATRWIIRNPDCKTLGQKWEPFGNFHFGATGRSVGFPTAILLQEAGRAHRDAGFSLRRRFSGHQGLSHHRHEALRR